MEKVELLTVLEIARQIAQKKANYLHTTSLDNSLFTSMAYKQRSDLLQDISDVIGEIISELQS